MIKKIFLGANIISVLLAAQVSFAASNYSSFSNQGYKVSFSYLSNWSLLKSDDSSVNQTSYFQQSASGMSSAVILATVAMPSNSYPKTNFQQAYVTVSVNPVVASLNSCKQYMDNSGDIKTMTAHKTISGNTFYTAGLSGAAAGSQTATQIYHVFKNGMCYEANLNLVTGNLSNYGSGVKKVNANQVWTQLNTVLTTLKFK